MTWPMTIACDGTCGNPDPHESHLRCGECGDAMWRCRHSSLHTCAIGVPDPLHPLRTDEAHCPGLHRGDRERLWETGVIGLSRTDKESWWEWLQEVRGDRTTIWPERGGPPGPNAEPPGA